MDGSIFEKKLSFKMLGLTFSSKLDWGSYIIFISKTASKKIGTLIRSIKFLSPEVALYLNKSTIQPCMEYCCHIWVGAPKCYLELSDKLQKHIQDYWSFTCFLSWTLGSLLKCSQSWSFIRVLLWQVFVWTDSTSSTSFHYSDRLNDFSVTIPLCYKDAYVTEFLSSYG